MRSWFRARWDSFKEWSSQPLFQGGRIESWLDNHFVDNWQAILKRASSIKLAVVAAAVVGVVLEFPALYLFILSTIVGTMWAALVAAVVGLAAIYFRLRADKVDREARKVQSDGTA